MPGEAAWTETVNVGPGGHEGHLDNIEIAQLLYDAWQRYFTEGLGDSSGSLFGPESTGRPTVRSISVRYDGEVLPGMDVRIDVRAVGRRNKGFTLEQTLSRTDDNRVLAVGTVVLVTVNPQTFEPVAVPLELWNAIETFEQRSIPIDT